MSSENISEDDILLSNKFPDKGEQESINYENTYYKLNQDIQGEIISPDFHILSNLDTELQENKLVSLPQNIVLSNILHSNLKADSSSHKEISDLNVNNEETIFRNLTYLGYEETTEPRREYKVNQIICQLVEKGCATNVNLIIPNHSQSSIRLLDEKCKHVINTFPISRIVFCTRGPPQSPIQNSFAFTYAFQPQEEIITKKEFVGCNISEINDSSIILNEISKNGQILNDKDNCYKSENDIVTINVPEDVESKKLMIFKCHVFSCPLEDKNMVNQIVKCFANSFHSSPEYSSDNDEPLMSGSGFVSREVLDGSELGVWGKLLSNWRNGRRPRRANELIRGGIPDGLRAEVWQLLCSLHNEHPLMLSYRQYFNKECVCEQLIVRDLHRTFPAHEFFKEAGGEGQRRLLAITRAYALHDKEIGYCQGVSFIGASLLLHLPEEQSFCVLVYIMYEFKLRELFRHGFQQLRQNFYQLQRLIQEELPRLSMHFEHQGIETHMFASQWFLTLFTSKFALPLVFHIIDVFLVDGFNSIFGIALALLKSCENEMLTLDFEGIFKYFRVHLPKKFRTESSAKQLMQSAIGLKPSTKKLEKWASEFALRGEEAGDRGVHVDRQLKEMMELNLSLERECDLLALEIINSNVNMRTQLDQFEDSCEMLKKELLVSRSELVASQTLLSDAEEERCLLINETNQLKELCRRELEKLELDNSKNKDIITEYKQICSQMSQRLETQSNNFKTELNNYKKIMEDCEGCKARYLSSLPESPLHDSGQPDQAHMSELDRATTQLRQLELELARTKLALVESECRNQDLNHQISNMDNHSNDNSFQKNKWLAKTISSITNRYKSEPKNENKQELKSEIKSELKAESKSDFKFQNLISSTYNPHQNYRED